MTSSTHSPSPKPVTPRPQRPEPTLELRESDNVRPRLPDEDRPDGGPVDVGHAGDFANAATAHGVPEVDCELSRDLGDGVVRGDSGPVDAQLRRDGSGWSRAHRSSVPSVAPAILNGSIYRHAKEVMAALESYAPKGSKRAWREVETFVRDAAVLTSTATSYAAPRLATIAGPFVIWCTNEHGLALESDVIFSPRVIDAYCVQLSAGVGTKGTYRSLLMAISRVVAPAAHPTAMTPTTRRTIQAPYTATEMKQFRAWAKGQHTPLHREKATLLLALSAGAGLSASEIRMAVKEDVVADKMGVLIHVRGTNARAVPMLGEWERRIVRIAESRNAGAFLWGTAQRTSTTDKNLLAHFAANCTGEAPSHPRLRATWITTHLSNGTPVKELFRAGGITQLTTLHQYLEFVDAADIDTHRKLLRGARK